MKKLGLRTVQDRVIIKPDEPEKMTRSGLHLPNGQEKQNIIPGKVVAVGPGLVKDDGELVPLQVKVGDRVRINSYGCQGFKWDGQVYLVCRESEVVATEVV